MRYGPIDLTPFGAALDAVSWLYWAFVAGVAIYAWKRSATRRQRITRLAVILVLFGTLPALRMVAAVQAQYRYDATMALYQERCRGAGEKIHRTVEGVDGVVWMRWRDKSLNFDDQYKLDDPYGRDCGGEYCIQALLRVTKGRERLPEVPHLAREPQGGYAFVETTDPRDGRRYRYRAVIKVVHLRTDEQMAEAKRNSGRDADREVYGLALEREPIEAYTARYGITWDDVSTREDRDRWIAGGSLKAIDLTNKEVIAERVGYMVDRGQGSTAGDRSPWSWTSVYGPQCPALIDPASQSTRIGPTQRFAWRVLQPSAAE